jgi:hypothetical protein
MAAGESAEETELLDARWAANVAKSGIRVADLSAATGDLRILPHVLP